MIILSLYYIRKFLSFMILFCCFGEKVQKATKVSFIVLFVLLEGIQLYQT